MLQCVVVIALLTEAVEARVKVLAGREGIKHFDIAFFYFKQPPVEF